MIKPCLKTGKKQNMENLYLHKSPSKDCLDTEFKACKDNLMPEAALTSFTVSDSYGYRYR